MTPVSAASQVLHSIEENQGVLIFTPGVGYFKCFRFWFSTKTGLGHLAKRASPLNPIVRATLKSWKPPFQTLSDRQKPVVANFQSVGGCQGVLEGPEVEPCHQMWEHHVVVDDDDVVDC